MTIIQYVLLLAFLIMQLKEVHEMRDSKISTYTKFAGYEERNRTENITGELFGVMFKLEYFGTNSSYFGDEIYTLFSPILFQSKNLVNQRNLVRVEPSEND